jgi:hypothetical protein
MQSNIKLIRDLIDMFRRPKILINLMYSDSKINDPFFAKIVLDFYNESQKLHPRLLLIKKYQFGMAFCNLPGEFSNYLKLIEPSACRNYKKAKRNKYVFNQIIFNDYLKDIQEIRQSTDIRQGKISKAFLQNNVQPCMNPISQSYIHDYPYFGVLLNNKLVAYAGCLISGEMCMIEHIYGHYAYEKDGIVPMLIIEIVNYILTHYPKVHFYGYGTFFGAKLQMRRFKRKFGFIPYRVIWNLG